MWISPRRQAPSASKAKPSRSQATSRARSPAPRPRPSKAGRTSSTFTSSAKALARCPNGIRPIRLPTSVPGRCDHAHRVVGFSSARCRHCRGAELPPAKPVKLPDGHGKDLVETRCGLCHDLERVAAIKRSNKAWPVIVANMVERGATVTPDEAKTISDYLAANFGNQDTR